MVCFFKIYNVISCYVPCHKKKRQNECSTCEYHCILHGAIVPISFRLIGPYSALYQPPDVPAPGMSGNIHQVLLPISDSCAIVWMVESAMPRHDNPGGADIAMSRRYSLLRDLYVYYL